MATNTYVALDKVTVGTATPSITFTSIPQGYTDLVVVMSPATTHTLATFPYVRFNGDSGSNYSYTEVNGNGTSATSARDTNQTIGWTSPQMASISNTLGDNTTIVNIMNYSNSTTNKTYLSRANRAGSTLDYQGVEAAVGLWRNTAAITSVLIGNRRGGVDYNFSVGSTFSLYGIAAEGTTPAAKATGGAIYSDADYYYHAFASSGTFTPATALSCDVLVVAGGGGSGYFRSGGGGAGGLLTFTAQSLSTATTITVGAGGTGGTGGSQLGTQGSNSQLGALTAAVGGGYGGNGTSNGVGGNGGSGGGAQGFNGSRSGGTGTLGQGNAGGSAVDTSPYPAGGGGGAGAIGANGTGSAAGNGGIGFYNSLTDAMGVATNTGQLSSSHYYYAGGGGGGLYVTGTTSIGGLGGGGAGSNSGNMATAGTVNTGGGGGGSGYGNYTYAPGARGGSGIVIVRYLKV
jgi:hypothetical protein